MISGTLIDECGMLMAFLIVLLIKPVLKKKKHFYELFKDVYLFNRVKKLYFLGGLMLQWRGLLTHVCIYRVGLYFDYDFFLLPFVFW